MKKLVALAAAGAISLCMIGCSSGSNTEAPKSQNETASLPAPALKDRLTTEANTSARVDEIAKIAKADAVSITNELQNEAVDYISKNYSVCFESNESMELMMYYGGLLDYGCKDGSVEKDIGTDSVQVAKYVYRGAEAVDDDGTQENIRQIQEGLKTLGI